MSESDGTVYGIYYLTSFAPRKERNYLLKTKDYAILPSLPPPMALTQWPILKEVLRREIQGLKVYPVCRSYVFSMTGTYF
jgi:hypothetical protein